MRAVVTEVTNLGREKGNLWWTTFQLDNGDTVEVTSNNDPLPWKLGSTYDIKVTPVPDVEAGDWR